MSERIVEVGESHCALNLRTDQVPLSSVAIPDFRVIQRTWEVSIRECSGVHRVRVLGLAQAALGQCRQPQRAHFVWSSESRLGSRSGPTKGRRHPADPTTVRRRNDHRHRSVIARCPKLHEGWCHEDDPAKQCDVVAEPVEPGVRVAHGEVDIDPAE